MTKKLLFILPLILLVSTLNATRIEEYLIDTPTAKVSPVKTFTATSRIFSEGGLVTFFTFTPFDRFSIGTGITLEHIVGTNDEDIKVLPPSLQLKFQMYDGSETWPMLAIGFNNQGFYYNHEEDKYLQLAKGLYLSATQEVLFEGLMLNYGANVTTDGFEFRKLHAFTSLNYDITDYLNLMVEWDNIRSIKTSRVNTGLRFYVSEFFALDFAVRNLNNKAERILQIKYNYTF
ncbi:MAG: hypothetical protein IKP23_02895 [Elusimicrobiaceae bacterium]|nr:hypothetical protein [Elusimicrobiaceae bacterium]